MTIDIDHIAKLARLGLSEEEKQKFSRQMEEILAFVEKLKEVDVEEIEPVSHAVGLQNVQREDEPKPVAHSRKALLENAPVRQGDYIKVKTVLDRG